MSSDEPQAQLSEPMARWESADADPILLAQRLRFPYACNVVAPNRFMKSAMSEQKDLEAPGNVIIDRSLDSEERRAAFKDWTQATKKNGSVFLAQLFHPGTKAADLPHKTNFDINKLTHDQINELVEQYSYAATFSQECGFDGVEISCAYFFALGQFLTHGENTRTDEYGGSLENRARILFRIIQAIRMRVRRPNNFAIGLKLFSGNFEPDYNEDEFGTFIRSVEKTGFDYITITGGHYYLLKELKEGEEIANKHEQFYQAIVPVIKRNLTRTKLYMNGGFVTLADMCEAIRSGWAMGVSLARPVAAEPGLPNKLLNGEVKGAVKSLIDPLDIVTSQQIAGTQLWQHGWFLPVIDASNPEQVEQFKKDLVKHQERKTAAQADHTEPVIGYPKMVLCSEETAESKMNEFDTSAKEQPVEDVTLDVEASKESGEEQNEMTEERTHRVVKKQIDNRGASADLHENLIEDTVHKIVRKSSGDEREGVEIIEETIEKFVRTEHVYAEPPRDYSDLVSSGKPQEEETKDEKDHEKEIEIAETPATPEEQKLVPAESAPEAEQGTVEPPPEKHEVITEKVDEPLTADVAHGEEDKAEHSPVEAPISDEREVAPEKEPMTLQEPVTDLVQEEECRKSEHVVEAAAPEHDMAHEKEGVEDLQETITSVIHKEELLEDERDTVEAQTSQEHEATPEKVVEKVQEPVTDLVKEEEHYEREQGAAERSVPEEHENIHEKDHEKIEEPASEVTEDHEKVEEPASEVTEDHEKVEEPASEVTEDHEKVEEPASEVTEVHEKVKEPASEVTEEGDRAQKSPEEVAEEELPKPVEEPTSAVPGTAAEAHDDTDWDNKPDSYENVVPVSYLVFLKSERKEEETVEESTAEEKAHEELPKSATEIMKEPDEVSGEQAIEKEDDRIPDGIEEKYVLTEEEALSAEKPSAVAEDQLSEIEKASAPEDRSVVEETSVMRVEGVTEASPAHEPDEVLVDTELPNAVSVETSTKEVTSNVISGVSSQNEPIISAVATEESRPEPEGAVNEITTESQLVESPLKETIKITEDQPSTEDIMHQSATEIVDEIKTPVVSVVEEYSHIESKTTSDEQMPSDLSAEAHDEFQDVRESFDQKPEEKKDIEPEASVDGEVSDHVGDVKDDSHELEEAVQKISTGLTQVELEETSEKPEEVKDGASSATHATLFGSSAAKEEPQDAEQVERLQPEHELKSSEDATAPVTEHQQHEPEKKHDEIVEEFSETTTAVSSGLTDAAPEGYDITQHEEASTTEPIANEKKSHGLSSFITSALPDSVQSLFSSKKTKVDTAQEEPLGARESEHPSEENITEEALNKIEGTASDTVYDTMEPVAGDVPLKEADSQSPVEPSKEIISGLSPEHVPIVSGLVSGEGSLGVSRSDAGKESAQSEQTDGSAISKVDGAKGSSHSEYRETHVVMETRNGKTHGYFYESSGDKKSPDEMDFDIHSEHFKSMQRHTFYTKPHNKCTIAATSANLPVKRTTPIPIKHIKNFLINTRRTGDMYFPRSQVILQMILLGIEYLAKKFKG
uniref:NADH:flavin oxidoreductase/NADH oxidase N-terminal domain-containing protein n=1 Tax=Ascaris lumbricoides TaxID=6252 RepID=A0A9J2P454_ASCLU